MNRLPADPALAGRGESPPVTGSVRSGGVAAFTCGAGLPLRSRGRGGGANKGLPLLFGLFLILFHLARPPCVHAAAEGSFIPNVAYIDVAQGAGTVTFASNAADTFVAAAIAWPWTPTSGDTYARAGETIVFFATLRNGSNTADTATLARGAPTFVVSTFSDSAATIPISSAALASGGTVPIYIAVFVPAATADGTRETATVAATSTKDTSITETIPVRVTADALPPSPPAPGAPANGATVAGSPVAFSWSASTDSTSGVLDYRIEIATDTSFGTIVLDTFTSSTTGNFSLPVGNYFWRVRARDAVGFLSPVAETRSFTLSSAGSNDSVAMVRIRPEVISADTTRLTFMLLGDTGVLIPSFGDTVTIFILSGDSTPWGDSPVRRVTSGGTVAIEYARVADDVLTIMIEVERAGGGVTRFPMNLVQIESAPGTPVLTYSSDSGTFVLVRESVMTGGWRMVIRAVPEDFAALVEQANANLAGSGLARLWGSGYGYVPEREVYAENALGERMGVINPTLLLVMTYPDTNGNDDMVDFANMRESSLRLYVLDETDARWTPVPDGTVVPDRDRIQASRDHLSIYTILGIGSGVPISQVMSYPNPFYPALSGGTVRGGVSQPGYVTFDLRQAVSTLSIEIYDLNGVRVRTISNITATVGSPGVNPAAGIAYWDGRNDRGSLVASGMYYYIIDSNPGGRTQGRMTVIK